MNEVFSKKKRLMISIPMNGLTNEDVKKNLERVKEIIEPQGYEIVDSFIEQSPKKEVLNAPIWYMAKSLEVMSKCDAIYLCKGWDKARGCLIEYQVAMEYGMEIIKET